MSKYLLSRLFESSTWIGMAVIIGAFFAPRWFIIFLGLMLIFTGDSWLKRWVSKVAPEIVKAFEESDS